MPEDNDGEYRRLTPSEKSQIVNYAARLHRIVRPDGTGYSEREVLTRMENRFGLTQNDFLVTLNLIRDASNKNAAADNFNRNPNNSLSPFVIPRTPGVADRDGQYQYELLITATNDRTGERSTFSYTAWRNAPTSLSDLRDEISNRRGQFQHIQSPPVPSANNRPSDTYTYSTQLLSVGQIRGV